MRKLAPWIERRRRIAARVAAEAARVPGTVPYLGETLRLVPERGRTRVTRRGDALLVPDGDPREALERWYRREAREEVEWRLDEAVARAGTSYSRLTIRQQRTRWASCTAISSPKM